MVVAARGGRALGALSVAAGLATATLAAPPGHAQPAAPAAPVTPAPLDRARDAYKAAETAMAEGRFDDAIREYGAAYEASKDPTLFFKIGRANERSGKCDTALVYYARYLREGKPDEKFVATTRERIAACGGESRTSPPEPQPAAPAAPVTAAPPAPAPEPASQPAPAAPSLALAPSNRRKVAWVLTGTGIALVTLGGVLAYAANSSENDIRDLYVGFAGTPPAFDARTRTSYDDLVDKGRRYERLSWLSFGLAGATAVGAAVLFVVGGRSDAPAAPRVAPVITGHTAGFAVAF